MSCWVVPAVAADLWGMSLSDILRLIEEGSVPFKRDYHFPARGRGPGKPQMAPARRGTEDLVGDFNRGSSSATRYSENYSATALTRAERVALDASLSDAEPDPDDAGVGEFEGEPVSTAAAGFSAEPASAVGCVSVSRSPAAESAPPPERCPAFCAPQSLSTALPPRYTRESEVGLPQRIIPFISRLLFSTFFAVLTFAVTLTGCGCKAKAPVPGQFIERHGDEILVCGQLVHTGTTIVLWTDPGGYDAYRVDRRFATTATAGWEETKKQNQGNQRPRAIQHARRGSDGRAV